MSMLCVSAAKRFLISQNCEEYSWWAGCLCHSDKWGDCQLYLDSCPGGLGRQKFILPKIYSLSKTDFKITCIASVFQQKYVDANRFVLRSQMEYCYENHLERKSFPNTAKLMTCNITGHMTCFVKLLAQQIFIVKLTHL